MNIGTEIRNTWRGLTSMQKILVGIILLIIAWWVYNWVKARAAEAKQQAEASGQISLLNSQGQQASYDSERYDGWADEIFNAFDGWTSSSDKATVARIFGYLHNDIDFIKLDEAFGTREYSDNLFGLIAPMDLKASIHDELDGDQIRSINTKLKNKGLTRRI